MYLNGKEPSFHRQRSKSNPYYVIVLLVFVLVGLFVIRAFSTGEIQQVGMPTAIPTRTINSYTEEGITFFIAGDLENAMNAYNKALEIAPNNAEIWAEVARIQAYSSSTMTTDEQRLNRLNEALESANKAVEIDPDNSYARGIRAFVLDWYAGSVLDEETRTASLLEAEREAIAALTLDSGNTLALAYYAEIQVDQALILQAQQNIEEALLREEEIMDVHRVHGYVLESLGYYSDAINAYKRAIELNPNMTFLYIRIGVNYRQLTKYDQALEYFAKAAEINEANGVEDPLPYLAIGNTYSRIGEFFIAAVNVERVLDIDPTNPNTYGTLGVIYFRARNYESAIPALQCATYGCDAETSCEVRRNCDFETDPEIVIPPTQLTDSTVIYYYTYGSVLAGMHQPGREYCEEAMDVLADVRAKYNNEAVIMSIVSESENICRGFGY
ncbi:MAG: tetratricopeptide repeat protein [Anaerolineae bacterium]|jgi:tetratricopeptide (TPR) repeat protein|nr:tetratricopeptide repeat protein [Anaerolineae bacterium]